MRLWPGNQQVFFFDTRLVLEAVGRSLQAKKPKPVRAVPGGVTAGDDPIARLDGVPPVSPSGHHGRVLPLQDPRLRRAFAAGRDLQVNQGVRVPEGKLRDHAFDNRSRLEIEVSRNRVMRQCRRSHEAK